MANESIEVFTIIVIQNIYPSKLRFLPKQNKVSKYVLKQIKVFTTSNISIYPSKLKYLPKQIKVSNFVLIHNLKY